MAPVKKGFSGTQGKGGKGKSNGNSKSGNGGGKSSVKNDGGRERIPQAVIEMSGGDKKVRSLLMQRKKHAANAVKRAQAVESLMLHTDAGLLKPEHELEATWKLSQNELAASVDVSVGGYAFDLTLPEFGPYNVWYSRDGVRMGFGGRKGHISVLRWKNHKSMGEFHTNQTIRDGVFLGGSQELMAVAQKNHVHIYDNKGVELHCLRKHTEVNRLTYLPYHYLLVSIGNAGVLKYQDTSTGQLVAELKSKSGRCDAMAQNPSNAIIHAGHSNGTVTLWAPNMGTPLVKMLAHRSKVTALDVDLSGKYMATAALDGTLAIWDVRNTYKSLHTYHSPRPAATLAISQRGLLAVGAGPHVHIWSQALATKAATPYMKHMIAGQDVRSVAWAPFEDVLGVGHSGGVSSLIVPGSGEPNYDAFEVNPYADKKQRREAEVHALLDKIQPDMIALDPTAIGAVAKTPEEVRAAQAELARAAAEANPSKQGTKSGKIRKKQRGRATAMKRWLKKQQSNVVTARKQAIQSTKAAAASKANKKSAPADNGDPASRPLSDGTSGALARFAKR